MISLRRLLDQSESDTSASLLRACALLIEGIAIHAVQRDPVAYSAFRDALRQHRRAAEESASSDQVLVATGQVIQSMETYNREVEHFVRVQTGEFREIVRMLSRTLMDVSRESANAGRNLASIEKDLEAAEQLDDLRLLKGKMREALEGVAKESERQRESARLVKEGLLARLRSLQSEQSDVDTVTGLPAAAEAERAIGEAIHAPVPVYAAALCVERMDAINSRYGYHAGDRLMFQFAQEVGQRLSGEDKLFRWRGPTLVGVLSRPGHTADVRLEVARLGGQRQEHMIEVQGRTVLLAVSARFTVISLHDAPSLEDVLNRLNLFVAPAAGM